MITQPKPKKTGRKPRLSDEAVREIRSSKDPATVQAAKHKINAKLIYDIKARYIYRDVT